MAFKFRIRRSTPKLELPSFPSASSETDPEELTGMVNGMTASAPEERMAKALDKAGLQYLFRYTVGAPRGLPGWKELDFLIATAGMLQALEVDTMFTHRHKQQSDVLHDAIILNDAEINSYGTLYPQVMHVSGDSDLADQTRANQFVNRHFSRSPGGFDGTGGYKQVEQPVPSFAPVVNMQPKPVQAPVSLEKKKKKTASTPFTRVSVNRAQRSKIERMDK